MLLVSTTQTKVKKDLERMLDDGFLTAEQIKELGTQAEITAEATNDLYESLMFAMPAAQNEGVQKYKEFRELAIEMLEYQAMVVDAMICLKRQAFKVTAGEAKNQLKQAV